MSLSPLSSLQKTTSITPFPSPTSQKSMPLLAQIQAQIDKGLLQEAIKNLLFSLKELDAKNDVDLATLYNLLTPLVPHFTDDARATLLKSVQNLLNNSRHMPDQQRELFLILAAFYENQAQQSLDAMYYYAKAIAIGEHFSQATDTSHASASRLIMTVFCEHFQETLAAARRHADIAKFEACLTNIEQTTRFCSHEDEMRGFYRAARDVYTQIPETQEKHYVHLYPRIAEGLTSLFIPPEQKITQIYRNRLAAFREIFSKKPENVRAFQKEVFHQFKHLFGQFLEDVFLFLGPPPRNYDIRAMGSLGREEMCPFSDLEMMILVEDEKYVPYFKKLIQVLELQIASLNETPTQTPMVTCLRFNKNPSGFHIDSGGNPAHNADLIKTPLGLALLQKTEGADPSSVKHTALKSSSLHTNDHSLFVTYQKELETLSPELHRSHALALLNIKLEDFRAIWPGSFNSQHTSLNIKKQYVELLYHLLGHLALYWDIPSTNTLDILEDLGKKNIFSADSLTLLKESVETLYTLRIRTHLYYGEQKEEIDQNNNNIVTLLHSERENLEKIDHLVLKPLYSRLAAVLNKGLNFQDVFRQLDLVSLAFADAFNSLSSRSIHSFKRLIFHLVSHCAQEQAPLEDHEYYFKQLSKVPEAEPLRQTYLEVLGSSPAKEFIHALEMIPNTTGLRRAFLRQSEQLFLSLEAITTPELPPAPLPQVKVSYTSMSGERYLRPEIIQLILDEKGNIRAFYPQIQKDGKGSVHAVSPVTFGLHQLHFKQKPTQPLMEYAIHNLFFRIAGHLTPPTELVRFDVKIGTQEKMYPVLVSQTIQGKTLKEALNKSSLFSRGQLTWMLLCSILTRPGDGRLSNYVIDESFNLFCIDNDISFVEPVVEEWTGRTVNFCSALFCLFPETQRLSSKVLEEFCSLNADVILNAWIEDVIEKEKAYLELFSDAKERDRLYNEDPKNRFKATILFQEGALATLNLQFYHLQDQIRTALEQDKEVNALTLLNHLIHLRDQGTKDLIGPHVYTQYKKALAIPDLEKRLQEATDRKQKQSLTSIQSDYACYGKTPTLEEVEKRQLYSPSKAREELFSVLLSRVADHVKIGKIQTRKVLQANFKHIAEASRQKCILDALLAEINRSKEKPLSVVLQNCLALNSKTLEPFLYENLEVLDLRFCKNIQDRDVVKIQQQCLNLKELYLSGCSQIRYFTGGLVTATPLEFNKLHTLHIDQCDRLLSIKISAPLLTKLKCVKNTQLQELDVSSIALPRQEFFKKCPNLVKNKINFSRWHLDSANEQLKSDKDIVRAAVSQNARALKYANKQVRNDKDVIHAAVLQFNETMQYGYRDDRFKNDKDVLLAVIKQNDDNFHYGSIFKYFGEQFKNDKEVILEAVKHHGYALEYASDELKNDKEIVLETAKHLFGDYALEYASDKLKNDKEVVLAVVSQDGRALRHASDELKNDKEVVLAAVSQNVYALQFASDERKNDKDVVLAAINDRHGSWALEFASDRLKNDKDIVLAAVSRDGYAGLGLNFASEDLKNDKDIVLAAVSQNAYVIQELLRNDEENYFPDVKRDSLKFASNRLKNNKEIVLAAVSQDGRALECASEDLKNDKDVVLAAVKQNSEALQFASTELQEDEDILASVKTSNPTQEKL